MVKKNGGGNFMLFGNTTTQTAKRAVTELYRIKELIVNSDAVMIGAGAGLSTSAGFSYNGERFEKFFSDFDNPIQYATAHTENTVVIQTIRKRKNAFSILI